MTNVRSKKLHITVGSIGSVKIQTLMNINNDSKSTTIYSKPIESFLRTLANV
jgi:hypothetical protein